MAQHPLLTIVPGLVITVLALGFAFLGDGLQDRKEQ
jgi:peptide/nickel transport system permease protein